MRGGKMQTYVKGRNGIFVVRNESATSFWGATEACKDMGMQLATIKSAQEQENVEFLIQNHTKGITNYLK